MAVLNMLQIPHPIYHSIRHHGEQAYPLECCGILLGEKDGDVRTVLEALICKNVHDRPNKAYSIAPEALVETMRMAREQSLEVIGFYHSHPDHPPQWSTSDLDQAEWVGRGTSRRRFSDRLCWYQGFPPGSPGSSWGPSR